MTSVDFLLRAPIAEQIKNSCILSELDKEHFLHVLSYFTPTEIEELRALI